MSAPRRDTAPSGPTASGFARAPQPLFGACALAFALLLAACGDRTAPADGGAAPSAAEPAVGETPTAPEAIAPAEPAAPAPAAEFDPASVPESTATLPPPPFFATPEGLESTYADKDKVVNFDRHYFIAGDKAVAVEGKIHRERFNIGSGGRTYTDVEFRRNYENAIQALGGVKINTAQYTPQVTDAAGGRDALEKTNSAAAMVPDYTHDIYLIRQGGKEWWIDISTGAIPLHGYVVVLERQGMQQSVALLDAAAMKKQIDATGRVALYINFDIDKATLRPDAQPTIAEIDALLTADPALRLSIEGHTDDTGSADHNRRLSTARARSVLGALVGLGVDPGRLSSQGFGPDKPLADNGSEDGRAKNRRVELVKQ